MSKQRDLTPRIISEISGVNVSKVLGWIATGQLHAYDVGDRSRPRWRITPKAYEQFKLNRSPKSSSPQRKRYV